tara:strand:+ start:176 stop:664 length:489 start_codon:yes stop_codon:yes gene_type:complete
MPITLNGSGTLTGVSVGGLPDGIVDTDMLAANAVATAKIADDAITDAKQNLSGTAKAWVNFNGSGTLSVRDSFNVSSVTDNDTAKYTVNFDNDLPNNDYAFAGAAAQADEDNSNPCFCFPMQHDSQYNAGSVKVKVGYHNHGHVDISFGDRSFVSVAVFGDN